MRASVSRTEWWFFWGLVGGVALLAAAALAVALTRQQQAAYRTDDTPSAVVYNFLLALRRGEPDVAYTFLGDMSCKPSLDDFSTRVEPLARMDVTLGATRQQGDRAWVALTMYYNDGPFSEGRGPTEQVMLQREGGHWKIVRLPPELWPFSPPWPEGQCPPSRGGD